MARRRATPPSGASSVAPVPAMGIAGLKRIAAAISELDPDGTFVQLDVMSQTVKYSDEFIIHEAISSYIGEEEPSRAYIVCWLCTIGGYLPSNIELEKRYSIGRPKLGAELDILLKRPDGTPYALIETKAPGEYAVDADKFIEGQLFQIAPHEIGCRVLSYATVYANASEHAIRSLTIDYATSPAFEDWKSSRLASNEIPRNYGEPLHIHFEKGGRRDLRRDVSRVEFDRLRKRLHDVLWRGSTPENTIYTYVVKLFLAKIFDEKHTADGDRYRFQVYYSGSQREAASETFGRINALYLEAYDRYLNATGRMPSEPLNEREFTDEQLAFVVELLQDIALTGSNVDGSDVLGGFFEGITREGFKQSKGLFFTHINLVLFMLKVLQVERLAVQTLQSARLHSERLPYIIDPSCGSGTFLLAAMGMISQYIVRNRNEIAENDDIREFLDVQFPTGHENYWARDFIYGIDPSEVLSMATKVNMVLRRDGNTHIFRADGLAPLSTYQPAMLRGGEHADHAVYSKPIAGTFDVVVSNPPFSITLDPQTQRQLDSAFELAEDRNSENLFLERWYQLLKPHGRLGVVLPESFFSTQENLTARLFLFAHFNVKAVVSLPRHAFEPWTPTRTSLLFAEKKIEVEEREWKDRIVAAETTGKEAVEKSERAIRRGTRGCQKLLNLLQVDLRSLLDDAKVLGVELYSADDDVSVATLETLAATWEASIPATLYPGESQKELAAASRRACRTISTLQSVLAEIRASFADVPAASTLFGLGIEAPTADHLITHLLALLKTHFNGLKTINLHVWAFRTAVDRCDSSYHGLNVDNIGYKRTKRKEYERANDLFYATDRIETEQGSNLRRITDINLSPSGWSIVTDGSDIPQNALNLLQEKHLWG